jgi:hypothetical protein
MRAAERTRFPRVRPSGTSAGAGSSRAGEVDQRPAAVRLGVLEGHPDLGRDAQGRGVCAAGWLPVSARLLIQSVVWARDLNGPAPMVWVSGSLKISCSSAASSGRKGRSSSLLVTINGVTLEFAR